MNGDRKLKAVRLAMWLLFAGLLGCLAALVLAKESGVAVGALFSPFALAVGGTLQIFSAANVKEHEAKAAAGGGAP